jgi:hypothetical protein
LRLCCASELWRSLSRWVGCNPEPQETDLADQRVENVRMCCSFCACEQNLTRELTGVYAFHPTERLGPGSEKEVTAMRVRHPLQAHGAAGEARRARHAAAHLWRKPRPARASPPPRTRPPSASAAAPARRSAQPGSPADRGRHAQHCAVPPRERGLGFRARRVPRLSALACDGVRPGAHAAPPPHRRARSRAHRCTVGLRFVFCASAAAALRGVRPKRASALTLERGVRTPSARTEPGERLGEPDGLRAASDCEAHAQRRRQRARSTCTARSSRAARTPRHSSKGSGGGAHHGGGEAQHGGARGDESRMRRIACACPSTAHERAQVPRPSGASVGLWAVV